MKFFAKTAVTAVCLICLSGAIYASGGSTSAADFMKISMGARPAAMGSAFTAVADDANAPYWNPAGITALDRWAISLMGLMWYQSQSYGYLSAVMPIDSSLNAGLSVNYFNAPSFDSTDGYEAALPASYNLAVTATIAKNFGNFYTRDFTIGNISLGANLKIISLNYGGINYGTTAYTDLGLMANITDDLKFGITLKDMGPALNADPSPFSIKMGLSYNLKLSSDIGVIFAADAAKPVNVTNTDYNTWLINPGAEFRLFNYFYMRGGYMFGEECFSYTAGAGFAWPGIGSIDYAYIPHQELGATHRISLSVNFGSIVPRPVIGAPQQPRKVTAISGDRVVTVGWDPNPEANIIGYNIYYKEKGTAKFDRLNKEPMMEEAKFKAVLTNDVTYIFVVTAINNRNIESIYSSPVEATPKKYEAKRPAKLTGINVKTDEKGLVVTWNESQEDFVAGYNLYYKKSTDAKFKRLNQRLLRESRATLAGLTPGVRYYFMATSVSKDGVESDYSEITSEEIKAGEYY
ncbi:MAG: PorV/PorQ family protein [Spirochaetia bacterium]|nr:PorV/PorQ family protein [Spirochaetia bacterium]